MYITVESLCHTPETNMIHQLYFSVKKEARRSLGRKSNLSFTDPMLYASHCAEWLKYSETILCAIFLALVNKEKHWLMLSIFRSSHFYIRT